MNPRVVVLTSRPAALGRCVAALRGAHPLLDPATIIAVASYDAAALPPAAKGVTLVPRHAPPFVYAREANTGLAAAGPMNDVLLLNEDMLVLTPGLLGVLRERSLALGGRCLLSPGLEGRVALEGDGAWGAQYRPAHGVPERRVQMVPFMAAYLPAPLRAELGALDERFVRYGSEDDDYCYRARRAGVPVLVLPGCAVYHDDPPPALHRLSWGAQAFAQDGRIDRSLFAAKWGAYPPPIIPYDGVPPDIHVSVAEAVRAADAVPGWMGVPELGWLALQASSRRRIVELGSFHGRSARALACAMPADGRLWCVDLFNWVSELEPRIPIWDSFSRTHAQDIARGRVVPIRGTSAFGLRALRNEGVRPDMVFVDADHSYAAAKADIVGSIALLGGPGSGGLLCGHDYNRAMFPDVVRVVDELLPSRTLPTEGRGSIWAKVL